MPPVNVHSANNRIQAIHGVKKLSRKKHNIPPMPSYPPPRPPHINHTGNIQLENVNPDNLISGRSEVFKVPFPKFGNLHKLMVRKSMVHNSMVAGSLTRRRKHSRYHKKYTRKH